jgi:sugar phosphate isomerase/epimerase
MYKALSPGAIQVRAGSLTEAIAAAKLGGFQGVEVSANEIADLSNGQGVDAVRALFTDSGIRPAAFGLPVDWNGSEDAWRSGLEQLGRQAAAAAAVGCRRTATWIPSYSDTRPFAENRAFHIARFKPIAEILAAHDILLGLEFIGTYTLRAGKPYPFIYELEPMLDLGAAIGPNVGLLLDCWHWYTAHGTLEQLRKLKPEQVAYVHVNDAPPGVEIDEQLDWVRGLPGETGVIDIAGFLQALQSIGYDGPITPEPFKQSLGELPSDAERLRAVGESMDRVFRLAGI